MAEIRYDHREGPGKGIEVPCAYSSFHRRGGKFVTMSSGNATMAASGDTLAGWAVAGRDDNSGLNDYIVVNSGKIFIITGMDDVFEMPVEESKASLAVTHIGAHAQVVLTNSAATVVQKAKLGAVASPLSITRVDLTNKTVHVRINPTRHQAA